MTESPYVTNRETLLEGKYGTALLLQQFILHQYDASRYSSKSITIEEDSTSDTFRCTRI